MTVDIELRVFVFPWIKSSEYISCVENVWVFAECDSDWMDFDLLVVYFACSFLVSVLCRACHFSLKMELLTIHISDRFFSKKIGT